MSIMVMHQPAHRINVEERRAGVEEGHPASVDEARPRAEQQHPGDSVENARHGKTERHAGIDPELAGHVRPLDQPGEDHGRHDAEDRRAGDVDRRVPDNEIDPLLDPDGMEVVEPHVVERELVRQPRQAERTNHEREDRHDRHRRDQREYQPWEEARQQVSARRRRLRCPPSSGKCQGCGHCRLPQHPIVRTGEERRPGRGASTWRLKRAYSAGGPPEFVHIGFQTS
jgi:hypothetical protein